MTVIKLLTLYVLCLQTDYTVVAIKITIFWDVTSCTLIKFMDILEECAASIFRTGDTLLI